MKITRQAKREAKQLFRSCLVDGLLDEDRARRVAPSLLAEGRRKAPAILAQFLRLVKLDRERHAANIESCCPLTADLCASIEGGLKHRYGEGLTFIFTERPALIGGVRMQVGSDVYDGTVLARLEALEKRFLLG